MRLNEWIATQDRGAKARLAKAVGVRWNVIHYLCGEQHLARYALAAKISAETDGAVTIAELCEPPTVKKAKAKRAARKPAKRKRATRPPARSAA